MADTETIIKDFLQAREQQAAAAHAPTPLDYGGLIVLAMVALILVMVWLRRQERRRSGR